MTSDTSAANLTAALLGGVASVPPLVAAATGEGQPVPGRAPETSATEAVDAGKRKRRAKKRRSKEPRDTTVPWRLLSVKEAGAAIGRSRATIWRLIADGTLRTVKIGAATSIVFEDVERVIREGAPLHGRRPRPAGRRAPEAAD